MTYHPALDGPPTDDEVLDVAQVGYGPVGQTMAALLGRQGHRVAVVERQPGLYTLPRVGGIDHEIMRILQSIGVAEGFEPHAYPVERFDWRNADGKNLLQFDWSGEGPSGWARQCLIYQADLEEALDRAVHSCRNVRLYRGWEAVELTPAEDHVELAIRHRQTGTVRRLRARYLIGADGANSFVRQAAGIAWADLGYRSQELVIDYRPHDPLAPIEDLPDLAMVCDPGRPAFLMRRLGWKHARWEFALLPGETPQQMQDPRRAWELLAPWVTPADGELVRHVVYPFRSLLADDWRRGRVLLIGDAAHVMPPVIGQGVCTGIRDAATLAWKLDLVLTGAADDGLLDTYTAERRPHAAALIATAVRLARMWEITDLVEAAKRDTALLDGAAQPPHFPGLRGGVLHRDHTGAPVPPAGELFVQGRVAYQGRSGRYDDVVGPGFQVMAWNHDPLGVLSDDQLRFLHAIDARIVEVTSRYRPSGDVVDDLRGVYGSWFAEHLAEAVVVRPDYYVFGAVADIAELPRLVDDLRHHLRPVGALWRGRVGRSGEPESDGDGGGLHPVADGQLAQDVRHVHAGRLRAHEQPLADLPVGVPGRQQP
jgi:2-polyprenyl-6-methoxyphenol hydroxylase-like FAD-dependent oxidoreductase